MNAPKVSVLIPVFNTSAYLRECLDSVCGQTLKEIEIICINDGSTDQSAGILEEYKARDARVRVIHKDNAGFGHTMNMGINQARGEYVAFVESDDFIRPEMMDVLYHAAKNHGCDIAKGNFCSFIGEGEERVFCKYQTVPSEECYEKVFSVKECPVVLDGYIINVAGIYRREFLNQYHIRHNETPGASYQDMGFWFQVQTNAASIYMVKDHFYCYRHDNPNSSIASKEKVYCICSEFAFIYEKLRSRRELYDCYIGWYQRCKYKAYVANLKRIATEFREEFVNQMQVEFRRAKEENELSLEVFSVRERKEMEYLLEDADLFLEEMSSSKSRVINACKENQKIIIYGAGTIGREVLQTIISNQMQDKVLCVAVSKKADDEETMEGIPIVAIDELVGERDRACVIVAVTERYQEEMKQNAIELGFENIVSL